MAGISFYLALSTKGTWLQEETIRDFSEPFFAIIENWAQHNVDKFQAGIGAEATGVYQSADAFWDALSPTYQKRKGNLGYADWLMVRTGQLANSLTSSASFYQFVDPAKATFGIPIDEEAASEAGYNWLKRQTIFLDETDKQGIRAVFSDYLNYGPGWEAQKNSLSGFKAEAKEQKRIFRDYMDNPNQ